MAPTTKNAAGPPQATEASTGTGAFMLTLCRLEAPISIRPPQNPQLAQFKFFMSRSPHTDGSQRLHLHMGYFATLADAEKWLQVLRPRYPTAIATRTPPVLLRRPGQGTPVQPSAARQPAAEPPVLHGIPPAEARTLTDTQVLRILETRVQPSHPGKRPPDRPEISLLRPDDTNTRRALKEAVVQGAPISFVVQLCHSSEPIKLGSVPSLDIFRAYTLYLAEGAVEGTPWYALRMGFFGDAVSAKQVAYYARINFASVAVVPINDDERTRANQKPIALTLLARPFDRSIDEMLAADQAQSALPEAPGYPSAEATFKAPPQPASAPNRATNTPKGRQKDSLEQTLELLASSELWSNTDSDSLTETGVRHLKVEVKRR
jgi:hypothetical protein